MDITDPKFKLVREGDGLIVDWSIKEKYIRIVKMNL